jgi:diguanylate cyclase (GGDEF)-like protein
MRLTTTGSHIVWSWGLQRAWVTVAVVTALWTIFEVDRRTGSAPVQHLYYLPIVVASLGVGRFAGVATSLLAILLYHLANLAHFTGGYTEADVVQTMLFVVVGIVTAKLSEDARRLRQLATTDDLTGLHNLRSFEARLAAMVRASRKAGAPLAMFVIDVDRLKSINDAHGHLAGSEAVRFVGHTLASHLPPDAVACRYGGDEFAVAVSNCAEARARLLAEELRKSVLALAPVLIGRTFPHGTLSISIGIACLEASAGESVSEVAVGKLLFASADDALYVAKRRGRNRVDAFEHARPSLT